MTEKSDSKGMTREEFLKFVADHTNFHRLSRSGTGFIFMPAARRPRPTDPANPPLKWTSSRRAIMDTRIQLLSAVAAVAAALFATTAIADEIPKEGRFTSKVTTTGSLLQANFVGKGNAVNVYEENGTVEGSGGSHKIHCVVLVPFIHDTVVEPHGYCIETDQDGDQIVARTTSGTRPLSAAIGHSAGEVMLGTGKYAGMASSSTATCRFAGDMTKYSANCDVDGIYKMPRH
jgi:hypothetical protein